uniref:Transcription factor MYC/MYB N-terminal domain-containing protein n=1 Tax=Kalanchoe fedtschenkoi TaxID=63787 RepID=A0A7N0VAP0_KALFE
MVSASGINVPGNLRKQLAVAVRSVQWSYGIFWALSPTQQGVLQWGDGYYNGDIKTRKTFQTVELKPDKMGLQRSEQLRELYVSLLEAEGSSETQAKRHTAALSPEDLSDAEWYYLVCMSFVFDHCQDLPGSALAAGQPIWLCNAHYADSKVFSRSLLAKSASVQTVLCFPYLGGVIELGVTELVQEDANVIQHIKTSLLDFSKPDCSDRSHNADDNQDPMSALLIRGKVDATMDLEDTTQNVRFDQDGDIHEEFDMGSPDDCSFNNELHHHTEDSFMMEDINGGASQVQSWHFIDEEDFSTGIPGSINSSDCISQVVENHKYFCHSNKVENRSCFKELQECNDTKMSSLDITDEDLHYKRIVSTVLRRSGGALSFHSRDFKSSFATWTMVGLRSMHKFTPHQSILKKVLFEVPLMHCNRSPNATGTANEVCKVAENQRQDAKLLALLTMAPSTSQAEKASMEEYTKKYVQEVEARVEELQSSTVMALNETQNRKKSAESSKKTWIHKRKASHVEDGTEDSELNDHISLKEGSVFDMEVRIEEQEVSIEIRCGWRDNLLLDIMDAINNLHLEAHSVQSSTHDDIFTLSVNSKFRGTAMGSAGMIKQAIWKVAIQC